MKLKFLYFHNFSTVEQETISKISHFVNKYSNEISTFCWCEN